MLTQWDGFHSTGYCLNVSDYDRVSNFYRLESARSMDLEIHSRGCIHILNVLVAKLCYLRREESLASGRCYMSGRKILALCWLLGRLYGNLRTTSRTVELKYMLILVLGDQMNELMEKTTMEIADLSVPMPKRLELRVTTLVSRVGPAYHTKTYGLLGSASSKWWSTIS
jgi:hypothetical protein